MRNREKRRILLAFKSVVICYGGLAILVVVALVLFVVSTIRERNRQPAKELVEATSQIVASVEASRQLAMDVVTSQQAVINNAYCEDDSLAPGNFDEMEFLNVYWLEDGTVQQANSESAPIVVADGQSYNFSLAIMISYYTAQNVRAFIRVPNSLQLGETVQVEVLVLADNAAPYYDAIELQISNDTSAVEADGTSELWLKYHEDSAILRSNSLVDSTKLDYVALSTSQEGLLLGAEQMNGVMSAGSNSTCILSWTIDVLAEDASVQDAETGEQPIDTLWDRYSLETSKLENAPTGRSQK